MKKIKMLAFALSILTLSFIFVGSVNASELEKLVSSVYIKTLTGVKLTKTQYENLSRAFSKDTIMNLDPSILNQSKNITNLEKTETIKYLEITTTYSNDFPVNSIERELTKEEYNNIDVKKVNELNELSRISKYGDYHETTYKKITLTLSYGFGITDKFVTLNNEWKILPSVRKFDILAIAFEEDLYTLFSGKSGYQKWDGNYINYSSSSNNFKPSGGFFGLLHSGIALSQNIVDDTSTSLENEVTMSMVTNQAPTVRATYQHAVCSSITLSDSHAWDYNSSGMGGIIDFYSSSIENCYDQTGGLSASFPY
ncbi:MAG: hypothetical protein PHS98_04585 [Bacilli bacterium]|nr:hypothetical protein [Bacilli bacterium]